MKIELCVFSDGLESPEWMHSVVLSAGSILHPESGIKIFFKWILVLNFKKEPFPSNSLWVGFQFYQGIGAGF